VRCPGILDGSRCAQDGSDNYHHINLTYRNGRFHGTILSNRCSNNHYGFCEKCDPPSYVSHQHTAKCTEQRLPAVEGPAPAPLRGTIGLTVFGVNIYGPEEAGFGGRGFPAPCTDGSGECPSGMDVPTCEDSLQLQCGGSSKVQHSLMLDTCGGHAMPYHYHQDSACDYDHTLPDHSPLIGFALDGYGIYGLYESNPEKPDGLDTCNGHVGEVPNSTAFGVSSGSVVYHYHVTSWAPYTIGCYGSPDEPVTYETCKALYPPSSAKTEMVDCNFDLADGTLTGRGGPGLHRQKLGACDDGTTRVQTSDGDEYCYDLDCPCFFKSVVKLGRNSNDTSCLTMQAVQPPVAV